MWTRKELKERAKERFKLNYWKCILAALVLSIAMGGGGGTTGSSTNNFDFNPTSSSSDSDSVTINDDEITIDADGEEVTINKDGHATVEGNQFDLGEKISENKGAIFAIGAIVFVVVLLCVAFGVALSAFVFNPLEIGAKKFFVANLTEEAGLNYLGAGFSNCYMNKVKILFFRDLYVFLWGLLFVIPGIIKGYEYRMIPYILADNPEITKEEAFAKSKAMMTGNKWATFVLDLSFFGWIILSLLTCGILAIFYVNPYAYQTGAALYDVLKGGNNEGTFIPETADYSNYVEVE